MNLKEALENMLSGRCVSLEECRFKYIYFDKDTFCFKYNTGEVFVINENVVKDGWFIVDRYASNRINEKEFVVDSGYVCEVEDLMDFGKTISYTIKTHPDESRIGIRVAGANKEYVCDSKGFSKYNKDNRNYAWKELFFKNNGYIL